MSNEESVKKFYQNFNFEKFVSNPPKSYQKFLDGEINFLKKHILPRKTILEVGCGYGRLIKLLSERSKQIVGIDFSKFELKKGNKKLNLRNNTKLVFMNAKKMSFKDNLFDYVICFENTFGNMPGIESQSSCRVQDSNLCRH